MPPALFIAFRYLAGKEAGGARYLLGGATGIALSLVPIVVTLIVADGMIRGITDRFIELGTGHLQVWPYRNAAEPPDEAALDACAAIIREEGGARGVWKQRESLGIIVGGAGKTGTTIRAVEPGFWEDEGSLRYLGTIAGSARLEADNETLLGEELARLIGAEAGSTVRLMTARQNGAGRSVPRAAAFTVKGIVSSGYRELDAMWCVITYAAGTRILPPPPGGDQLIVKIDNPYKNAAAAAAYGNWRIPDNFWVYQWKDILRSQYSSYESTRQLLLFIMLLIVIVAAVNVSSAISILVIERQKEIAVLKAFGVSPRKITRVFLWSSFLTGVSGSCAGLGAGLAIGCLINHILRGLEAFLNLFAALRSGESVHLLDPRYYLQTIPIIVDWKTVALIGVFTVVCSCVSGFFPARKAGLTKPLDLFRKF